MDMTRHRDTCLRCDKVLTGWHNKRFCGEKCRATHYLDHKDTTSCRLCCMEFHMRCKTSRFCTYTCARKYDWMFNREKRG